MKMSDIRVAAIERFRRHPYVREVPIHPPESEDYQRILLSIQEEGIRDPLKCTKEGEGLLVLDGLHRLDVANKLNIKELPYVEVLDGDAVAVVCSALVRSHWSKSALAYRLWPMFEASVCCHGGNRRSKGNDYPLKSVAEIAAKIGVSEKMMDFAKQIHGFFLNYPDAKAIQEPVILSGQLPLHRAGRGYDAKEAKNSVPALLMVERALNKLPKTFASWEQIPAQDRERAKNRLCTILGQLPEDVQRTAFEALELVFQKEASFGMGGKF